MRVIDFLLKNSTKIFLWTSFTLGVFLMTMILALGYDPLNHSYGHSDGRVMNGGDYSCYYYNAKRFLVGDNMYLPELQHVSFSEEPQNNKACYIYPPFLAVVFTPLSLLPFGISFFIHTIVCVLLFLFLIYSLTRELPRNQLSAFFILTSLFFFSPILWLHLQRGQTDILVLFFLWLCFTFFLRQKNTVAGIFLGLAVAFKFTPIIFLGYFFFKKRSVFWSGLVTAGLISFLIGFKNIILFFQVISKAATGVFTSGTMSNSLFGVMYNRFIWNIIPLNCMKIIFDILVLSGLLFVFYRFIRATKINKSLEITGERYRTITMIEFSLLLIIMIVLPNLSNIYNAVYGLFAFITFWILKEKDYLSGKMFLLGQLMIFLILSQPVLLPYMQSSLLIFSFRALYLIILFVILFNVYLRLVYHKPSLENNNELV